MDFDDYKEEPDDIIEYNEYPKIYINFDDQYQYLKMKIHTFTTTQFFDMIWDYIDRLENKEKQTISQISVKFMKDPTNPLVYDLYLTEIMRQENYEVYHKYVDDMIKEKRLMGWLITNDYENRIV